MFGNGLRVWLATERRQDIVPQLLGRAVVYYNLSDLLILKRPARHFYEEGFFLVKASLVSGTCLRGQLLIERKLIKSRR